jgi:DNA polymerase-3 subunit beta
VVRFALGATVLTTKIIDGKFPDYTRVVPANYQKRVSIQRLALLQSLQRAAILSNEKFRGVRWMVSPGSLRISCTNNEQEEAQEELEITYSGEALDIGFNITYILDVLNNVHSDAVECAFGDANSSMLVTVPDIKEFRYVVMPMRI